MSPKRKPVRTYGLTHVAIEVKDPQRSFRFYEQLLGARLLGSLEGREADDLSGEDWIEFGTPGSHDVLVLMRAKTGAKASTGTLAHFGFRLARRVDPERLAAAAKAAGATGVKHGRFPGGGPYVFARDPDGYVIELWFEDDPAWRR